MPGVWKEQWLEEEDHLNFLQHLHCIEILEPHSIILSIHLQFQLHPELRVLGSAGLSCTRTKAVCLLDKFKPLKEAGEPGENTTTLATVPPSRPIYALSKFESKLLCFLCSWAQRGTVSPSENQPHAGQAGAGQGLPGEGSTKPLMGHHRSAKVHILPVLHAQALPRQGLLQDRHPSFGPTPPAGFGRGESCWLQGPVAALPQGLPPDGPDGCCHGDRGPTCQAQRDIPGVSHDGKP